jgi:hypothetical protein
MPLRYRSGTGGVHPNLAFCRGAGFEHLHAAGSIPAAERLYHTLQTVGTKVHVGKAAALHRLP